MKMDVQAEHSKFNVGGDAFSHNNNSTTYHTHFQQFYVMNSPGESSSTVSERSSSTAAIPLAFKLCPIPPSPFIGREDILESMKKYFFEVQLPCYVLVLFGPKGFGKSAIAAQFIYQCCHLGSNGIAYSFYVDGTSQSSIEASFCDIATVARCGGTAQAAIQWISDLEKPWVLLIDDADDTAQQLESYLPTSNQGGRIIITSRHRVESRDYAAGEGSSINVGRLLVEEAISLVSQTVTHQGSGDRALEEQLVRELDFSPTAIRRAVFVMNKKVLTPQEYVRMSFEERRELHVNTTSGNRTNKRSFTISENPIDIAQLEQRCPIAVQLLYLFAFLNPESISEEIFSRATSQLPKLDRLDMLLTRPSSSHFNSIKIILNSFTQKDTTWCRITFRKAIDELVSLSIVKFGPPAISISPQVHSQLQLQTQLTLKHVELLLAIALHDIKHDNEKEEALCAQIATHVTALFARIPIHSLEPLSAAVFSRVFLSAARPGDTTAIRRALVGHIDAMLGQDNDVSIETKYRLARALSSQGHWKDCLRLTMRVSGRLGEEPDDASQGVLSTIRLLASKLNEIGKREDAISLLQWLLKRHHTVIGSTHQDTLATAEALAMTLRSAGWLRQQVDALRDLSELCSTALGDRDPRTLSANHFLAEGLEQLGQWQESSTLADWVLNVRHAVLRPDDPQTWATKSVRGAALGGCGELKQSKQVALDVFRYRSGRLGQDDTDTLLSKLDLSYASVRLGQFEEGKRHAHEAVEALQRELGSEHQHTLAALLCLARALGSLGKWKESRRILSPLVTTMAQRLGPDHWLTHRTTFWRAGSMRKTQSSEDTLPIAEQCVQNHARVFGLDNPHTLEATHLLAKVLGALGRWDASLAVAGGVFKSRSKVLGERHRETLRTQVYLASIYTQLKRWQEAQDLAEKCLAIQVQVLGPNDPKTVWSMNILAYSQGHLGNWQSAAQHYTRALEIRRNTLGREDPDIATSCLNLSIALNELEEFEQAEPLARETVERYQKLYGSGHESTKSAVAHLAMVEKGMENRSLRSRLSRRWHSLGHSSSKSRS